MHFFRFQFLGYRREPVCPPAVHRALLVGAPRKCAALPHAYLATTPSIRTPALSEGPSRPDTFDSPPCRAREGTPTSAIGRPARAALTTISRAPARGGAR